MAVRYCGCEAGIYSTSIVNVIKGIGRESAFGFTGSGFIERKRSLKERIERLMSENYRLHSAVTLPSAAGLVITGLVGIAIAGSETSSESMMRKARQGDTMIHAVKGKLVYMELPPDTTSAYFRFLRKEADRFKSTHPGYSMKVETTGTRNGYQISL